LQKEAWDAIIIDHAAIGWALGPIREQRSRAGIANDPALVYVSHNHEAKIRREIAKNSGDLLPKKLALQLDAEKYAWQEDKLCQEADLVTAITETEVEAYRENFPSQNYLCLTPGYEGEIHRHREIIEETPRRVVMSGSFEWIAKRINLERFLEVAARPFADAGIELQIVGKTEENFRQEMLNKFPEVDFVGRVPEMAPYLLNARMGLIVEEFGGGFKLKTLEYIFHGLPLAGLYHAVEGLPLSSPEDILLTPDIESLIAEVSRRIDDFDCLNQMRKRSIEICEASFRWEDRGRKLSEAIHELRGVALAG
ncbi:MAG: glycosyltransferase, partial [Verrucomicrobiota bacterium]